ncbi:hypothetical protein [Lacinutrix chionoecetis]
MYKNQVLNLGLSVDAASWETGIYFCKIKGSENFENTIKIVVSQ